jgi:hypothetical protein
MKITEKADTIAYLACFLTKNTKFNHKERKVYVE